MLEAQQAYKGAALHVNDSLDRRRAHVIAEKETHKERQSCQAILQKTLRHAQVFLWTDM